jgi:hypothetical protein
VILSAVSSYSGLFVALSRLVGAGAAIVAAFVMALALGRVGRHARADRFSGLVARRLRGRANIRLGRAAKSALGAPLQSVIVARFSAAGAGAVLRRAGLINGAALGRQRINVVCRHGASPKNHNLQAEALKIQSARLAAK